MDNGEPKVTTDDLARMVADGFADMRVQIDASVGELRDEVKGDFAAVNKQMNGMQQSLSHRIDQVELKLNEHRQESKDAFSGLHRLIAGISTTLSDHEERIRALEGE